MIGSLSRPERWCSVSQGYKLTAQSYPPSIVTTQLRKQLVQHSMVVKIRMPGRGKENYFSFRSPLGVFWVSSDIYQQYSWREAEMRKRAGWVWKERMGSWCTLMLPGSASLSPPTIGPHHQLKTCGRCSGNHCHAWLLHPSWAADASTWQWLLTLI